MLEGSTLPLQIGYRSAYQVKRVVPRLIGGAGAKTDRSPILGGLTEARANTIRRARSWVGHYKCSALLQTAQLTWQRPLCAMDNPHRLRRYSGGLSRRVREQDRDRCRAATPQLRQLKPRNVADIDNPGQLRGNGKGRGQGAAENR